MTADGSDLRKYNTVFIIGNGAVQLTAAGKKHYNAFGASTWSPLRKAFYCQLSTAYARNLPLNSEWEHVFHAHHMKIKKVKEDEILNWTNNKANKNNILMLKTMESLYQDIAAEYQFATKTNGNEALMELRELPQSAITIINSYGHNVQNFETIIEDESVLFITTNWDLVLDRKFSQKQKPRLLSIHGKCDNCKSLIFPNDLIDEERIFRLILEHWKAQSELNQTDRADLLDIVTDSNTLEDLLRTSVDFIAALTSANNIVLWGLALNDYDAEFAACLNSSSEVYGQRNVLSINPSELSREKAALLLNISPNKRVDIDPGIPTKIITFN